MEVTLNFFFRFLRWSPHELLVFLNVPLIWGSENSQCFDSKPSGKVVISLQKSHFVSLIFYFFKHQFYGTQQIDFPMTQKNVVINHARQRKKKVEVLGKQYAPAFAIHRKLSQFPPPAFFSLYIFWHLKNGFHVW